MKRFSFILVAASLLAVLSVRAQDSVEGITHPQSNIVTQFSSFLNATNTLAARTDRVALHLSWTGAGGTSTSTFSFASTAVSKKGYAIMAGTGTFDFQPSYCPQGQIKICHDGTADATNAITATEFFRASNQR